MRPSMALPSAQARMTPSVGVIPKFDLFVLSSADATVNGVTVSASTNESKFGINPTLGVQFKAGDKMNVDVHGAYTDVFTDVSSTAWIDFGIGLEFMLQ